MKSMRMLPRGNKKYKVWGALEMKDLHETLWNPGLGGGYLEGNGMFKPA